MAKNESAFDLPIYCQQSGEQKSIFHSLTDTHCHLDYLKSDPLDVILQKAAAVGIERVITISTSVENFRLVLDIASSHQHVFATQGIHPHQAKDCTPEVMAALESNLSHDKVVAVGEIGLDYHYDFSPRQKQIDVFEAHLELARKHQLPVVIHSREADDDMQAILGHFPDIRGVIHSFTSSLKLAQFALSRGLYLGFNGIITFKNAQNVRDVLLMTPHDRILLETDSPYLAPVPWRGRENTPANIPWVASFAMQLLAQQPDAFLARVEANAKSLFGINS